MSKFNAFLSEQYLKFYSAIHKSNQIVDEKLMATIENILNETKKTCIAEYKHQLDLIQDMIRMGGKIATNPMLKLFLENQSYERCLLIIHPVNLMKKFGLDRVLFIKMSDTYPYHRVVTYENDHTPSKKSRSANRSRSNRNMQSRKNSRTHNAQIRNEQNRINQERINQNRIKKANQNHIKKANQEAKQSKSAPEDSANKIKKNMSSKSVAKLQPSFTLIDQPNVSKPASQSHTLELASILDEDSDEDSDGVATEIPNAGPQYAAPIKKLILNGELFDNTPENIESIGQSLATSEPTELSESDTETIETLNE
jgi:hypothetical protein